MDSTTQLKPVHRVHSPQNSVSEDDRLLDEGKSPTSATEDVLEYCSTAPNAHNSPSNAAYGEYRRVTRWIALPTLLTALLSTAIASILLGWLLANRVTDPIDSDAGSFHRALVAVEQKSETVQNVDGSVTLETRLYGLTLSSIGVQVLSMTMPWPIALFGAWIASAWWRAMQEENNDALPTPLQYGLLVKLLGVSGSMSIYATFKYLRRGSNDRANVSSYFILSFIVVLIILSLRYSMSIADTWLHTTASTIIYRSLQPLSSSTLPSLGSTINSTLCPGPAPWTTFTAVDGNPGNGNFSNCLHLSTTDSHDPLNQWGTSIQINEGSLVLNNGSSTSQVMFIEDMAVLVPKELPNLVEGVHFTTFGIQTQCVPSDCFDDISEHSTISCQSFTPVYNVSVGSDASTTSTIGQYNIDDRTQYLTGYPPDAVVNPAGALLLLSWTSESKTIDFPDSQNSAGWYQLVFAGEAQEFHYYIAECSVSTYNVSLVYSTLQSQISTLSHAENPIKSNFNTSMALLAGMDNLYPDSFVNFIQNTLQPDLLLPEEAFNSILSRNMSAGLLAVASPLLERQPALNGSAVVVQGASRYPLAPLSIVLTILYGYALMSFTLTLSSLFLSSPSVINKPKITMLELAQARLTDPVANIADHFSMGSHQPLKTSAVDLFPSERAVSRRLGYGLIGSGDRMHFGIDDVDRSNGEK
ncbi:hypothetical protein K435DRAFT_50348 [Dendrothele bispora CBS 962.96]|uniref:Uncharacterized protein n=1 Tax=Dendrothele bispora (strain CBS 962.96) TaxID=1314807 RepID=A0A4S8M7R1_DENBC|nr:hypothetical protein K435DRAFT_50348 [Dendrothele bispora CBS 962.96]